MALSEHEQRALQELERSLLADDPKFGSSLSDFDSDNQTGGLTLRGIAVIVIGLLLLVGGVALSQNSLWFVVLSVAGFFVMLGGGIWMLRGGGQSHAPKPKKAKKASSSSSPNTGSLGGRMEDNFRKRFE